ncbi:hypothetical protein KDW_62870 [Dictyobacter vulcani]|uniref:Uncharacterized protein n=1 Tax=Dictyobacter vulcani TaxID=2607529 RepID=A0A5J4KVX7_9CHLR|nr:hypothetical protein KDW_62870 [Dictyobacter vulcani]
MAKATKTITQAMQYPSRYAAWFTTTQALFNTVASFYFEVITAHEQVLLLSSHKALHALETLTHATEENPDPVMPLDAIAPQVPALFRRAAIHAALGSAHAFETSLQKWRARKEKAALKKKRFTEHPRFPRGPGIGRRRSTRASGKGALRPPFFSSSGQGRGGSGSTFGS